MSKTPKDKPSCNSLRESLRHANEEAKGYLEGQAYFRKESEGLRKQVEALQTQLAQATGDQERTIRIFWVVLKALEDTQAPKTVKEI